MKIATLPLALVAALAMSTSPALAQGNSGKNKNKGHKSHQVYTQPSQGYYGVVTNPGAAHCPPGLAKKAVPCVPPGQVKNYRPADHDHYYYLRGDYLPGGYVRIDDPARWGLQPGPGYVRYGDYVYRINEQTREVLNLIGAVADILN